jgi:hypothetical protein
MTLESFENLSYGTDLTYVGPDEVGTPHATPKDRALPYMFKFVSHGGTVVFSDTYNGHKELAPDHPCNNPAYWERVDE